MKKVLDDGRRDDDRRRDDHKTGDDNTTGANNKTRDNNRTRDDNKKIFSIMESVLTERQAMKVLMRHRTLILNMPLLHELITSSILRRNEGNLYINEGPCTKSCECCNLAICALAFCI